MNQTPRIAFYDFDGTLTRGNVVRRYAYLARRQPSRARAILKTLKLFILVPVWIALDLYSRRLFNEIFFREYRGLKKDWLVAQGQPLFDAEILPSLFAGARDLVEQDRAAGFLPVLVSGELDFALKCVVGYFHFEDVICNSLEYKNGTATGEVVRPLIAEAVKVKAMTRYCAEHGSSMNEAKAYSDSYSDVPMLQAVGSPAVVRPDRRLRRIAFERGWPVLNL